MKAAEIKPVAQHAKTAAPFFNKGQDAVLQKDHQSASNFFNTGDGNSFFIQTKLNLGRSNDAFEQEADFMADRVLDKQSAAHINPVVPMVQRKCKCCEEDEKKIQRKISFSGAKVNVNSIQSTLMRTKGQGKTLPAQTQMEMSRSFNADFSNVRIHDHSDAVQMNNSINAQAFTHKNDIYFNQGKFDPESKQGKHLLAHELTHVIQQGAVKQEPNALTNSTEQNKSAAPNQKTENNPISNTNNRLNPETDGNQNPSKLENAESRSNLETSNAGKETDAPAKNQNQGSIATIEDSNGSNQNSDHTENKNILEQETPESNTKNASPIGGMAKNQTTPQTLDQKIRTAREGYLKRIALQELNKFDSSVDKSKMMIEQIAAMRLVQVHQYFKNIRTNVRNFFLLRINAIMSKILEKQMQLILLTNTYSNLIRQHANMITQQGIAMTAAFFARINSLVLAASSFISNLLNGIKNQILNLINSIPLPDVTGVEYLRNLIISGVTRASNTVQGAMSIITGVIQQVIVVAQTFIIRIITGINNAVNAILNQVFQFLFRIQTKFIRIVLTIGNKIIRKINGLLNNYIFPTLARGEALLISQILTLKRRRIQEIKGNRLQYLGLLGRVVIPNQRNRRNRRSRSIGLLRNALFIKEATELLIYRNREIVMNFFLETNSIFNLLIARLQLIIERILEAIQRAVQEFITSISNLINSIITAVVGFIMDAIMAFVRLIVSIARHIVSIITKIISLIANIQRVVINIFSNLVSSVGQSIRSAISNFVSFGSSGSVVNFAGPAFAPALAPALAPVIVEVTPIVIEIVIVEIEIVTATAIVAETAVVSEAAVGAGLAAWEIVLIVVLVIVILIIIALIAYFLYLLLKELLKPAPLPIPVPEPVPDPDPDQDDDDEDEDECEDDLEFRPSEPTGLLGKKDPIPITWYKPISQYPEYIVLRGYSYYFNKVDTLPEGEPIGIYKQFFPYVGKIMQMAQLENRGREAHFKAVFRRYGFDWNNYEGQKYSPDHVQDIMWEGEDRHENFWPLERSYNSRAGNVQNQTQRITFRPHVNSPCAAVNYTIIKAIRRFGENYIKGRMFIIRDIKNL